MIGNVAKAAAAGLEFARIMAEKAKDNDMRDAGAAQANVANWEAMNEQLQKFKDSADRVERDADYAQLVQDHFTSK